MKQRINTIANSLRRGSESGLIVTLVIVMMFFGIMNRNFFSLNNFTQIATQMVELSLITIGMSICIISGGFDLSIGALMGLGTVFISIMLAHDYSITFTLVTAFLALVAFGALNGFIIGYLKINPMLTTLGTSSLITGLALIVSRGKAISGLPESFFSLGQSYVGKIPNQTILLVIIIIITVILMSHTKWGRNIYLIGDSYRVSMFTGINCSRNIFLVYVYSSIMAFFAALVLTSRLGTGRADLGDNYVLQSVAAAILGGIRVTGGSGNILGAITGVFIFVVISNGFNLLNVSQYLYMTVTGVMLILLLSYRIRKENIQIFFSKFISKYQK